MVTDTIGRGGKRENEKSEYHITKPTTVCDFSALPV
jgi:hypothetical protein